MNRVIAISTAKKEQDCMAAVLEDGWLVEYYSRLADKGQSMGNVYKGRVKDVLPGMSAAFVDIGLGKNAFLFEEDVVRLNDRSIDSVFSVGDEIVVQVKKEKTGAKGPRLTMNIALAGRYTVCLPRSSQIRISRKITDSNARQRLQHLGEQMINGIGGIIMRTAALDAEESAIFHDWQLLKELWQEIEEQAKTTVAPSILHDDSDVLQRLLRDLEPREDVRVVVDQSSVYDRLQSILDQMHGGDGVQLDLHQGDTDLFDSLGVCKELERASKQRIWLKSGGYLVFDHTEALTVIDVNTGKNISGECHAQTVLQTNMEAATVIPKQLRLRNIGGIIIVDFIDMHSQADRDQVLDSLEQNLKTDSSKTWVCGFTQLGLVEMTRKRGRRPVWPGEK